MNEPTKPKKFDAANETDEQYRARMKEQARIVRALLPFLPGPSVPEDEQPEPTAADEEDP